MRTLVRMVIYCILLPILEAEFLQHISVAEEYDIESTVALMFFWWASHKQLGGHYVLNRFLD